METNQKQVQVVTGDSQEEVIIFRYRHTLIIIYISSLGYSSLKGIVRP